MKEATSPSKICKIDLFKLTFQKWPKGSLEADYRLLNKDEWVLGAHRYEGMWSQQTTDALTNLIGCMEEDAMKTVFGAGVAFSSGDEEKPYEEIITREHVEYEGGIDIETQF